MDTREVTHTAIKISIPRYFNLLKWNFIICYLYIIITLNTVILTGI